MNINDLLKAMMTPRGQQPAQAAAGDDPLAGILGALLGGGGAGAAQQPGSGGGLEDILGGLLGGAGAAQQPGGGGGLEDILGGLLGGAGAAQQPGGGSGLEDILGGLLGGAGATPGVSQAPGAATGGANAGGLMQTIIQVLGGRQEFAGIIEGLAAKLGLPPAMAQAVVAFVLEKLLSGGSATGSAAPSRKRQPAVSAPPTGASRPRKPTRPDSGSLRDLFQQGARIEPGYLKRSGLANELAQRTGMDTATATQSLNYVFGALQGQASQLSSERTEVEGLNAAPQGHRRDLPNAGH